MSAAGACTSPRFRCIGVFSCSAEYPRWRANVVRAEGPRPRQIAGAHYHVRPQACRPSSTSPECTPAQASATDQTVTMDGTASSARAAVLGATLVEG
eukprot:scaffold209142_cov50-Tisochrysis_lutea.AAC.3